MSIVTLGIAVVIQQFKDRLKMPLAKSNKMEKTFNLKVIFHSALLLFIFEQNHVNQISYKYIYKRLSKKALIFSKFKCDFSQEPFVLEGCPLHSLGYSNYS